MFSFRFAKHLDKCRRSYTGPELAKCRFNTTHFFQREEMAEHERICSDRLGIERGCLGRKAAPEKRKIETDEDDKTSEKRSKAQGSDRWDDVSLDEISLNLNNSGKIYILFRMKKKKAPR